LLTLSNMTNRAQTFQKQGADNEMPPILQLLGSRKLRRLCSVGSHENRKAAS
jgi:hypothetical protein